MVREMNWRHDFRRMLSSRLGYWRGLRGGRYRCPSWADEMVFAMAYKEGHRVYLDRVRDRAAKSVAAPAKNASSRDAADRRH